MRIKSCLIQYCAVFFILLSASCQTKQKKIFLSPPGYDLRAPVTLKLSTELDEISGITFYQKDSTVFGIEDEDGIFFKMCWAMRVTLGPEIRTIATPPRPVGVAHATIVSECFCIRISWLSLFCQDHA